MTPTKEELLAAAKVLERLRGFSFAVKEAAARSPNPHLPDDYLPTATMISTYLAWGSTALQREAAGLL